MNDGRPVDPEEVSRSIDVAVQTIRDQSPEPPNVAVITDTAVPLALDAERDIDTGAPGEPWVFGRAGQTRVAVVSRPRAQGTTQGYPTGWSVRVLGRLGVPALVLTDTVGALNPSWAVGDAVCVDDHLNLLGENPLIGPNIEVDGPRFPEMSQPYDAELSALADAVALSQGVVLRRGIYAALPGPGPRTPAERRMLRVLGAEMVGTRTCTVSDVIVARQMGLRAITLALVAWTSADTLESVKVGPAEETVGPTFGALVYGVLEAIGRGASD